MTPQPPPVDAEDDLRRILPLSPSPSLHKDPRPPTATRASPPGGPADAARWRLPVVTGTPGPRPQGRLRAGGQSHRGIESPRWRSVDSKGPALARTAESPAGARDRPRLPQLTGPPQGGVGMGHPQRAPVRGETRQSSGARARQPESAPVSRPAPPYTRTCAGAPAGHGARSGRRQTHR